MFFLIKGPDHENLLFFFEASRSTKHEWLFDIAESFQTTDCAVWYEWNTIAVDGQSSPSCFNFKPTFPVNHAANLRPLVVILKIGFGDCARLTIKACARV